MTLTEMKEALSQRDPNDDHDQAISGFERIVEIMPFPNPDFSFGFTIALELVHRYGAPTDLADIFIEINNGGT